MIDINKWINNFSEALQKTFGTRIWFVGLQGSYGRGEATETSDIDLVVILDEIFPEDIRTYGKMLDGLPNRELVCGFSAAETSLTIGNRPICFSFSMIRPRSSEALTSF